MITKKAIVSLLLAGVFAYHTEVRSAASVDQETAIRFAVLGDRTGDHVEGIQEQIIAEIERLKPDFVVNVGDMIEGYTEDTVVLKTEWDEYMGIVSKFSMPLYYTPGNHDITTDAALPMYKRYVGEPYHSFDERGLHFIVLDNSRWTKSENLPKEQIDWLVKDLEKAAGARYTFVFCHKPFWYQTTCLDKPDTLHSLFLKFGVDAVFTGHFHRYFSGLYDGIYYTSIGSSGGDMEIGPTGIGYHFGWVTVDPNGIHIAPVNIDGVLAWDDFTAEDLHRTNDIQQFSLSFAQRAAVSEELVVPGVNIDVIVSNISDEEMLNDSLRWNVSEHWSVTPAIVPVNIEPGKSDTIRFQVASQTGVYPVPTLHVKAPLRHDIFIDVQANLPVERIARCVKASETPFIDGKLTETVWGESVARFFGPDGENNAVDSTRFYFAYDAKNFYVAARCQESRMDSLVATVKERDGGIFGEDCIGLFIQPNIERDTAYQIYFNPLSTVFDQLLYPAGDGYYEGDRKWDGTYEVKTSTSDGSWLVEARIPLEQFGIEAKSGDRWKLNFRRKQKRLNNSANWQVPIDYNPKTFGVMIME